MQTERREIVFSRGFKILLGVFAVAYVIYWLRAVLTPVFLAFAIAYILDPIVDRFEKLRLPRPVGIVLVLGGVLALLTGFILLVVPSVLADIATVAAELPRLAMDGLALAEQRLSELGIELPHSVAEVMERFGAELQGLAGSLMATASGALGWIIGSAASLLGSIVGALIVPVFAIYLLNDFDRITHGLHELLPARYRGPVASYAREIDVVLSQFLRGQLTVMLVLAVLYGGAYALLGVRLAIPIGIMAGVLNIIPYLGSAFALVAGLLMSLLGGWNTGQLIGVVIAYGVVQTLEGFVITPRIVGKNVGLKDVWVLFALFLGGELFGFLGVLLAVPGAAVAKIFIRRWVERYRSSELFRTE